MTSDGTSASVGGAVVSGRSVGGAVVSGRSVAARDVAGMSGVVGVVSGMSVETWVVRGGYVSKVPKNDPEQRQYKFSSRSARCKFNKIFGEIRQRPTIPTTYCNSRQQKRLPECNAVRNSLKRQIDVF